MNFRLSCSDEVRCAQDEKKPLVALESTIITHGMPYPRNLETARMLEATVREYGATPATIAIIEGVIRIGLDDEGLALLARAGGVAKLSRRDLPWAVAGKKNGAVTVAATMICARLAGIEVFATGGIGGVHRGGQESMDVSADLTELAQTDVAVICAGAKAILDIGRTLEYLETLGVPVVGYRTDSFPAFYTRESAFPLPLRLDSAQEVAEMIAVKWALGLRGGVVVANPVPGRDAMDPDIVDAAIEEALAEAEARHITGKAVTPFLLQHIVALTGGDSLETNISLVRNNAALAARIATALVHAHSEARAHRF